MKKIRIFIGLLAVLTLLVDQSAQAQRRWSPQAKGTVIGVGVGGAAGAIINKRNRVVGGVIGGVVGGAAGYAIGKRTDNKRKEAARVAAANRAAVARAEAERAPSKATEGIARNRAVRAAGPVAVMAPPPVVTAFAAPPVAAPTTSPVLKSGYLPNATYGDQTAPYGMSPYRRKSW